MKKTFLPVILLICLCSVARAQSGLCRECFIPSFGVITLYHVYQPGYGFGLGMEAGNWSKDDSRFSYFFGAKLQWPPAGVRSIKVGNSDAYLHTSFYAKGQVEMIRRLYVVLSPQVINLSTFEAGVGVRYVLPLSRNIGIGVEPTYLFFQKAFSMNTNIHFAL
ncbi:MAG TPA: hypothetical protein VMI35_14985 [Puia sp.]|nr:hypothetical protein [Puia sp.]